MWVKTLYSSEHANAVWAFKIDYQSGGLFSFPKRYQLGRFWPHSPMGPFWDDPAPPWRPPAPSAAGEYRVFEKWKFYWKPWRKISNTFFEIEHKQTTKTRNNKKKQINSSASLSLLPTLFHSKHSCIPTNPTSKSLSRKRPGSWLFVGGWSTLGYACGYHRPNHRCDPKKCWEYLRAAAGEGGFSRLSWMIVVYGEANIFWRHRFWVSLEHGRERTSTSCQSHSYQ